MKFAKKIKKGNLIRVNSPEGFVTYFKNREDAARVSSSNRFSKAYMFPNSKIALVLRTARDVIKIFVIEDNFCCWINKKYTKYNTIRQCT